MRKSEGEEGGEAGGNWREERGGAGGSQGMWR